MDDDEADIRGILGERDRAVARGDAAGAVAALDTKVVSFDLQPPLRLVGDEARDPAGLEDWFSTWDGPIASDFQVSAVLRSGDLAVAHGLTNLRGEKKGHGPINAWFRSTVVLGRSAGGWRIVHDHHSYPMRMDGSGLAAEDLRP